MTTSAETTTEPTPSETASISTNASPASSPARRPRRPRSKALARPARVASVKELLVELERLQHRAVVLDHLANEVSNLFGREFDEHPRYLIGVEGGTAIPARPEVVLAVEVELRRAADVTRAQIRQRLESKMTAPAEEPAAPITEGVPPPEFVSCEEGDEELASMFVRSVSNPRAEARARRG